MFVTLFVAAVCVTLALGDEPVIKDCGPADAYIKFNKIEITPHPINIFGKIKVNAQVETRNTIGPSVRMKVVIKKENLGNKFIWEVPCTNIRLYKYEQTKKVVDVYFGTCEYKGLACDFPMIQSWLTNGCPAFFKERVPCACPFPPKIFDTKGWVEVDLSRYKDYVPSWIPEGGYDAKVEFRDTANNDKLVGCLQLNVVVVAERPCPAVLKRLNACP